MDEEEKIQYGLTIISLLEHYSNNYHAPILANFGRSKSSLKRRIRMIKKFHKKSYRLSLLGIIAMLIISMVSLLNANAEGTNKITLLDNKKNESSLLSKQEKPTSLIFGKAISGNKTTFRLSPVSAETGIPIQISLPVPDRATEQPGTDNAKPPFLKKATNYYTGESNEFLISEGKPDAESWFKQQMEQLGYSQSGSGNDNVTDFLMFKKNKEPEIYITFREIGSETRVQFFADFIYAPRPDDSVVPNNVQRIEIGYAYPDGKRLFIDPPNIIKDKSAIAELVKAVNDMEMDTATIRHCTEVKVGEKQKGFLIRFITSNDEYDWMNGTCGTASLFHKKQAYSLSNQEKLLTLLEQYK
jgi:hypothetical protein